MPSDVPPYSTLSYPGCISSPFIVNTHAFDASSNHFVHQFALRALPQRRQAPQTEAVADALHAKPLVGGQYCPTADGFYFGVAAHHVSEQDEQVFDLVKGNYEGEI
jgi:hypothetical protein